MFVKISSRNCGGKMKNLHKFNKIFVAILFFACILGVGSVLSACGDDNSVQHEHVYSYIITQNPTCTETGTQLGECSCGHSVTIVLNALGHEWEEHVTKPASCEEEGLEDRICTRCSEQETHHVIPALGHDYTDWKHVEDSDGNHNNDQHSCYCRNDESDVKIEPCVYHEIDHKLATCTSEGYVRFKCDACNHEVDVIDPIKPHQFNDVYVRLEGTDFHAKQCAKCEALDLENKEACVFNRDTQIVEAGCESSGYTRKWCEHCDNYQDSDFHDATGHDYESSPYEPIEDYDNDPTNNRHRRVCKNDPTHVEESNCHFEIHVVNATCTIDGYVEHKCKDCGFSYKTDETEHFGHSYQDWQYDGTDDSYLEGKHKKVCSSCGDELIEACDNTEIEQQNATCLVDGYKIVRCRVCKNQKSYETLNHEGHKWGENWQKDDENHFKTCTVCGEEDKYKHTFKQESKDPTCREKGYIKTYCEEAYCDYEKIVELDKNEHFWSAWKPVAEDDTKCYKECQNEDCSEKLIEAHDFVESNICSKCQADGLKYTLIGDADSPDSYYVLGEKVQYNGLTTYRKAFGQCSNSKKIIISGSYNGKPVKEINRYAFSTHDAGVQTLIIQGTSITTIREYAFMDIKNLTSVTLSESIKRVETYAFGNCINLSSITCGEIDYVGPFAFKNTDYVLDKSNWVDNSTALYLANHLLKVDESVATFSVKENTVGIAESAFENCTNLIEVKLVNTIKEVFNDAFKNCPALSNVVFTGTVKEWLAINFMNDEASPLKEGVSFHITDKTEQPNTNLDLSDYTFSSIPAGTFRDDTNLVSVTLPDSVTSIGANAFNGCSNLATIKVGNKINFIGDNAFFGTKFYLDDENWKSNQSETYNGILYLHSKDNSTHYLIATNADFNYETYTILDGTRVICSKAFDGRTALKNITLPSSLRYIGALAFNGCNLVSATFVDAAQSRWLANNSQIGRTPDILTASDGANSLKVYNGAWINHVND